MSKYQNDESISSDDSLWRSIEQKPDITIIFDENRGAWRPSSAAFDDDRNAEPMSAYLQTLLHVHYQPEIEYVQSRHPGCAIASINVAIVRNLGQGVIHDGSEGDLAHVLVCGEKTQSIRKKMAKQCTWIVSPKSEKK